MQNINNSSSRKAPWILSFYEDLVKFPTRETNSLQKLLKQSIAVFPKRDWLWDCISHISSNESITWIKYESRRTMVHSLLLNCLQPGHSSPTWKVLKYVPLSTNLSHTLVPQSHSWFTQIIPRFFVHLCGFDPIPPLVSPGSSAANGWRSYFLPWCLEKSHERQWNPTDLGQITCFTEAENDTETDSRKKLTYIFGCNLVPHESWSAKFPLHHAIIQSRMIQEKP